MGIDEIWTSNEGPLLKLSAFMFNLIEKPVVWVRENIVLPNRKEYYWYHEKLRRVPTVDECYTDDAVCIFEANEQYKRDKSVDKFIREILRKRYEYCVLDNLEDREECEELKKAFNKATVNYFIKYGELGFYGDAVSCLMKQKNRMAWERRHGPVGSGRRPPKEETYEKTNKKTCD